MRTVSLWNRLPRDTEQCPSGEVFKTQVCHTLRNMSWFHSSEQEVGLEISWGTFTPQPPCHPTAGAIPYENEKWQEKAIRSWRDESEISESMKQVHSYSRGSTTISCAPQQQLGLTWQDRKHQSILVLINDMLFTSKEQLSCRGWRSPDHLRFHSKNLSHFATKGYLQQLGIVTFCCLKMPY